MPAQSTIKPTTQSVSWDRTGTPPILSSLTVTVIEIGETQLFAQYSIQFIGTGVEWLYAPGLSDSYLNIEYQSAEIPLALQNTELLAPGIYKANVIVEISNDSRYIRTISAEVILTITGSVGISTDKAAYNLTFNRANNTLSGDTAVSILNNTTGKSLSFWQPSTVFQPKTDFTDGFTIEDNASVPMLTNPALPDSGSVSYSCRLVGSVGEIVSNFTVNLLVLNEIGIGVSPESLNFEVIKNTSEKSAILSVTNPLGIEFTVEAPEWLILSQSSGNATANITVQTSTGGMNAGIYSSPITVYFAKKKITVPVTLNLKQFITLNPEPINFCLDFPPILFSKISPSARSVQLNLKAIYNVMGQETVFQQAYLLTYINGTAEFNLGQKIHAYFPRYRKHLFEIKDVEFMKLINCSLKVEEVDKNSEVLLTESIDTIKFLPGSAPKAFPIMSNFSQRSKHIRSKIFFTKKEGDVILTEQVHSREDLTELVEGESKIKLYSLPENFSNVHVQWENNNLMPEWFTFTGAYTISADFIHISAKNVINTLLEKFETSKIKKIQVNTGFILRHELPLIEEMIDSKLAFMQVEGMVYRCYNVTPKISLQSSADMIVERDMEFLIVEV